MTDGGDLVTPRRGQCGEILWSPRHHGTPGSLGVIALKLTLNCASVAAQRSELGIASSLRVPPQGSKGNRLCDGRLLLN